MTRKNLEQTIAAKWQAVKTIEAQELKTTPQEIQEQIMAMFAAINKGEDNA
jgi:hypothetical protein